MGGEYHRPDQDGGKHEGYKAVAAGVDRQKEDACANSCAEQGDCP
ncbi:Uncharacterised protein [Chlamydia trachomatis]|nr:Uncharacterised protein [Chlamydia trachomatis]